MFPIVCDPSSGSTELYLSEIIRSVSQIFVPCLVGVWQRHFEPVVCVCVRSEGLCFRQKYSSVLPDEGSHRSETCWSDF